MGGLEGLAQALAVHIQAKRQGVDEDPQGPLGGFGALQAAHQHSAEHHLVLARQGAQHPAPGQVEQAGRADPGQPGPGPQALAQLGCQGLGAFLDGPAIALHILQAVRQGRLVDIAEHLAEERFVLLFADAQPRLGHVVAKRHGRPQALGLPGEEGLHLVAHHIQGAVVQGHVVEQQHGDDALPGFIPGMHQAQQRRLADVQAIVAGVETRMQLGQNLTGRRVGLDLLQLQPGLAPDHLHRLLQAIPEHRGAQDVVPRNDPAQGLGKGFQAFLAGEGELRLHHIGVALLRTDVVVENALLQGRQGVDVLHVGDPARDAGDNALDGLLVEVGQGQHRRGDAADARGDAIGRHLHLPGLARRILAGADQLDQLRLVLAQAGQQLRFAQGLLVALDQQLVVLEHQLHILFLQCRQQFDHAHRTISIRSVMAA